MLKKFTQHIEKNFPFLAQSRFYLAVSGGIDSMVMVHLFQHFRCEFGLLHCNFKLRGEESDADMRFLQDYAQANNLQLRVGFFETKEIAGEIKQSVQVTARMLRYDWFYEQMEAQNAQYVLTAHHADDNLETFLINLSRGTGLDGLLGIPEQNDKILRPLLPFSREEIAQYAQDNKILWREDTSNASDDYLRNKIRHHLTPVLKELNPDFLQSFQKTQKYLEDAAEMVEDAASIIFSEAAHQALNGDYHFNIQQLNKLPNRHAYLYHWLRGFGFTAWPDVFSLLTAQSGKKIFSPTHLLLKDRDELILSLKKNDSGESYLIDKEPTGVNFPLKFTFCKVSDLSQADPYCIFVDEDTLVFPLTLRKWQEADFFYPLGMKGKKKLSKYFKDEKFSLLQKKSTWLLCSQGQIVWIVGSRQDERFKVTTNTTKILKITATT